jgi:hypothetical protein
MASTACYRDSFALLFYSHNSYDKGLTKGRPLIRGLHHLGSCNLFAAMSYNCVMTMISHVYATLYVYIGGILLCVSQCYQSWRWLCAKEVAQQQRELCTGNGGMPVCMPEVC